PPRCPPTRGPGVRPAAAGRGLRPGGAGTSRAPAGRLRCQSVGRDPGSLSTAARPDGRALALSGRRGVVHGGAGGEGLRAAAAREAGDRRRPVASRLSETGSPELLAPPAGGLRRPSGGPASGRARLRDHLLPASRSATAVRGGRKGRGAGARVPAGVAAPGVLTGSLEAVRLAAFLDTPPVCC